MHGRSFSQLDYASSKGRSCGHPYRSKTERFSSVPSHRFAGFLKAISRENLAFSQHKMANIYPFWNVFCDLPHTAEAVSFLLHLAWKPTSIHEGIVHACFLFQ
jgi:hypothetical protein